jgi:hypothetical protein
VGAHPIDPHDAPAHGRANVPADAGGAGSRDAGVGEVINSGGAIVHT